MRAVIDHSITWRSKMARVLVVDDEKLIVKGIRFSLEQDGYEVDCAYDGDEAIERAKERELTGVFLNSVLFFLIPDNPVE